jgi:hypothetical protein
MMATLTELYYNSFRVVGWMQQRRAAPRGEGAE